ITVLLRRARSMPPRRRKLLLEFIHINIERPLVPDVRFDPTKMNDTDAELNFRFDLAGLHSLVVLLGLPDVFVTSARDRCCSLEALCILLNRMSRESICHIFNDMVDIIFDKWEHVIYFCKRLAVSRLDMYAAAIEAKGAPLSCVFGFIDGSKIATCRIAQPRANNVYPDMKRHVYSGHKRHHCLNFQAVTAPDGLCLHFWGPLEGSRHDTTLLRESKLCNFLDENKSDFSGYLIYGDPAYGVLDWVFSGYKGPNTTSLERAFNREMSSVRQSVEWSFGRMKSLWAFITYKDQQKIMLQNIGKVVSLAMFLTNCDCCYNGGNQISSYFGLTPPSLQEYLQLNNSDVINV
ncbi:hypothetical protein AeRB84_000748, partial [Aphanomyces euteiches]